MKLVTLMYGAAGMLLFSTSSCAGQDISQTEVPSVVVNSFAKVYPGVKAAEWEKKDVNYEAEFEIDTTEHTILLDGTGAIVQSKQEIMATELPEAVSNSLAQQYQGQQVDDAELVEKSGQKYYQVELEGKLKDTKLVFDEAGNEQKDMAFWD